MSLFDLVRETAGKYGRTEARISHVNSLYEQMINNPEVYSNMYSAISSEMMAGSSGGNAFSWSVSMNNELLKLDEDAINKDPVEAMTRGAIYKMAEVAADAYRTYQAKGLSDQDAAAAADNVLFSTPSFDGAQSLYESLTTPGSVGKALSALTRVDREGELSTHYMFMDMDGDLRERIFSGITDYDTTGKRLDVGDSGGVFAQLILDRTAIGNAIIKTYDYFSGNSPSFFTNYRAAAVQENLYGDKAEALVSPGMRSVATVLGYGGAIAENFLAAGKFGSLAMLGVNVAKGRLTDYEYSSGMSERFDYKKFMNSMLYDTATSAVGIGFSQVIASGIMGSTFMGKDGIEILRKVLRTTDPKLLSQLIAAPVVNMSLNTATDMTIDYTFHHLAGKVIGYDNFTPMQNTRFDIGMDKEGVKKLVNEFMFRSAMVVGSGLARSALTARVAGDAPMLSNKWFDETFSASDKRTIGYKFKTRTAALMWNIYPSNVKAVDQIMKDGATRISLATALKETSAGQMEGFGKMYHYFWHLAERQSNSIYRWMTSENTGMVNVDRAHALFSGSIEGLELLTSSDDDPIRLEFRNVQQAEAFGQVIEQVFGAELRRIIGPDINDRVAFLQNVSRTGRIDEHSLANITNAMAHVYRLLGYSRVEAASDNEKAEIYNVISSAFSKAINDAIYLDPAEAQPVTAGAELSNAFSKARSELAEYLKPRAAEPGEATDLADDSFVKYVPKLTNVRAGDFSVGGRPDNGSGERFFAALLDSIAGNNALDGAIKVSKERLDAMSERIQNYMRLVEEAGELGVETGYLTRERDGDRTYYRPTPIETDTGVQVEGRSRQQLFPFISALTSIDGDGQAGSIMPVISELASMAGTIRASIDNQSSSTNQKISGFFSTHAAYLDLMGRAAGKLMIADIDSALETVNDKGASNATKALAILKAKQTSSILGDSFYKYASKADQQTYVEKRAQLNKASKTVDITAAKIGNVSQGDLFMDITRHEILAFAKATINPIVNMDYETLKAYGLDTIAASIPGRTEAQIISEVRNLHSLLDASTPTIPHTRHLGRFVRVVDSAGNKYEVDVYDLVDPLGKLDSFEEGKVLSDAVDSVLGHYVYKKINIELQRYRLSLIEDGRTDEAAALTHKSFLSSAVSAPLRNALAEYNINVRFIDDTTEGRANEVRDPGLVEVSAIRDGGFGVMPRDREIGSQEKHDLFMFLTSNMLTPKEINSTRPFGGDPDELRPGASQQYYVNIDGNTEVMGLEQTINYLKGNIKGLPEMVQAMTYARTISDVNPSRALSDEEVGVIMRAITEKLPGFSLTGSTSTSLAGYMSSARTIINRLMLDGSYSPSSDIYSIKSTMKRDLGVEASVSRQTGFGVGPNITAYNVSIRPEEIERWPSIQDKMNALGYELIGQVDSTMSTYLFARMPDSREDVVASFRSFQERMSSLHRRFSNSYSTSGVKPLNQFSEPNDFTRENIFRILASNPNREEAIVFAQALSDAALRRGSFAEQQYRDTQINTIRNEFIKASDEHALLLADQSSMTSAQAMASFAKLLQSVRKIEVATTRIMYGETATEEPTQFRLIPEVDEDSDYNSMLSLSDVILGHFFRTDDNPVTAEAAASNILAIRELEDLFAPSTPARTSFDEIRRVANDYTPLPTAAERDAWLRAHGLHLEVSIIPMVRVLAENIDNRVNRVHSIIKQFNSSGGGDSELDLVTREIDDHIAYLEANRASLGILASPARINARIQRMREVAREIETQRTVVAGSRMIRFGDILSGAQKVNEVNLSDEPGVRRYVYQNIFTDGFASAFEISEVAKRFSAATTTHITSESNVDDILAAVPELNGIQFKRVAEPPSGTTRKDGEARIAASLVAQIERYANATGLSMKVLSSLFKVQVVEDSSLDPGIGIEITTGDMKSQSAAFAYLFRGYAGLYSRINEAHGNNALTVLRNASSNTAPMDMVFRDRRLLRSFLLGLTAQSNPVDGLGEGVQSGQFNNMGISASIGGGRFNPKGLNRKLEAEMVSGAEFRNSIKAGLRNSRMADQGSYQMYNSEPVTQPNRLIGENTFERWIAGPADVAISHPIYGETGQVLSARASYQVEIPLLTLAKQVVARLKGKDRAVLSESEREVLRMAHEMIDARNRNAGEGISRDAQEEAGVSMLHFLSRTRPAGEESKNNDPGMFYVRQEMEFTNPDGSKSKEHVYLALVTRFSADGAAHTLPYLVSRIGNLGNAEKIGLTIRSATAQSGDFDKDTVILSTFTKNGLRETLENRFDYEVGSLSDDRVLDHLFALHDKSSRLESANSAKRYTGVDSRGMTDISTQILFGRLIKGYEVHSNGLALARREGVSGKLRISFDQAKLTDAGFPASRGDATTEDDTLRNPRPAASEPTLYNFRINENNLVLFVEGKGSSEYDRIMSGTYLGGVKTNVMSGGRLSAKGFTWQEVDLGSVDGNYVIVLREAGIGKDVVGLYRTSAAEINRQLGRGNIALDEARYRLSRNIRLNIEGGNIKAVWPPDAFRSNSATFVDYIKSYGGEKGLYNAFGDTNIDNVVYKADALNRILSASQAFELIEKKVAGSNRLFTVPVEYAERHISRPGAGRKVGRIAFGETVDASLIGVSGVNEISIRVGLDSSSAIRDVADEIRDRESVIKGGYGLIGPQRKASEDPNLKPRLDKDGNQIGPSNYERFTRYVEQNATDTNLLGVLPNNLKGLVEVMTREEWAEARSRALLPKALASHLRSEDLDRLRSGKTPILVGDDADLVDKAFAARNIVEALRNNFPMYVTKEDLKGIYDSAVKNEMLLDGINNIEELAKRVHKEIIKGATNSSSAFTLSTVTHFLSNVLNLDVVKGRPYSVRNTEDLRTGSKSGYLNTWVNSARKEGKRMVESVQSGVWGNLVHRGDDKPITTAKFYEMLVGKASASEDRGVQVLSRAVYTAMATSAVAPVTRTDMVALGLSYGAQNIKTISESLGTGPGETGLKYKMSLDVLKKINTPSSQAGQNMLDEVILDRSGYKYSTEPNHRKLKDVCNV